nr:hypothetical protein [Tanacetum cinerariifolium]
MIAKMDQDDAVVMEEEMEEDREVADAVKDIKEAKVDESAQDQGRQAESQAEIYKIDMDHANKVLSMQEDETELAKVQEVVDVVTNAKLITEVVTAASETVTAAIILNGDSPAPTRVVEGVLQPVASTTVEQKLAKKNELKARGTLLMDLPDKHQLKFNSHKDAKTLMESIEKRFGGNKETKKVQKTPLNLPSEWKTHILIWRNKADLEEQSLDDLFNSLKIYEAEVKSSSSIGTTIQNLAFVSYSNTDCTTESVSATASVSAVCAKMPVSSLPNVDSLSNAIDSDDLQEMDLKWQMAMLTMRARRFLQRTRRNLRANGPTSLGFDMSKVECYNCHRKGYFARECRSPKDSRRNGVAEPQRRSVPVETSTSNALVSQCDGVRSYDWSFQAEEEPANYALMAFSSLSSSSDNEVLSCSKACSKAYAQLHSQYDKLTTDFHKSQFDVISYQTGLESVEARLLVYKQNESIFKEDIKLLKFEVQFQPSDRYHVVPPPYTRTFMTPKPDLVFTTAPTTVETDHLAFTVQLSPTKPEQDLSHTNRPTTPIIEDWVSDSKDESETKAPQIVPSFVQSTEQVKSLRHFVQHVETSISAATPKPASPKPTSSGKRRNRKSKPVSITAVRPVSAVVPQIKVTRPKQVQSIVTKPKSPIRRHITRSPSLKTSNSPPRVTAVKVSVGNPQHALKDKGVIDSGCSQHMTGNMSYLSDFEELNGGYVAFGGNPKG